MNILEKLSTPRTSKRNLLFVAAVVWTFAGGMLLFRGFLMAGNIKHSLLVKILISMVLGVVFYIGMFSKISLKHITRILNMQNDKPGVFSFFNGRSYILMTVMITSGILLRTSGLIKQEYLSMFYIIMGTPLLLSASRFYYRGFNYPAAV